jgi:hypothetical protein
MRDLTIAKINKRKLKRLKFNRYLTVPLRFSLTGPHDYSSEEKKLLIAALSQQLPRWLMLRAMQARAARGDLLQTITPPNLFPK